jgi:hypothetical protein
VADFKHPYAYNRIRNQEIADWQLDQFELKISAAPNPINRPSLKPSLAAPKQTPALLEVIGFIPL